MAIRIAIDPGHSKATPGKRAGKYYEYKSNRNIAKILYKLLEDAGFNPVYTVALEAFADMPLYQRAQVAKSKNAHALVSIHNNAHSDPKAKGTETFIHTNTEASVPFAHAVHSGLLNELGTHNRGVKRANFGILRASYKDMLCCLTEGEFFTTPETRKWMLTSDFEEKYAVGVFKGLCNFYGVSYKDVLDPMSKGYLASGDNGDIVKELQSGLAKLGYDLSVDGNFGPNTESQLKAFQKDAGLKVDGYYGPNTQKALEAKLSPKRVEVVTGYYPEDSQAVKEIEDFLTKRGWDYDIVPALEEGKVNVVTGYYWTGSDAFKELETFLEGRKWYRRTAKWKDK